MNSLDFEEKRTLKMELNYGIENLKQKLNNHLGLEVIQKIVLI